MKKKCGLRGFIPEDDRTFFTSDLNREELQILFDGIRKHRIKQTRLRLNASKEKRKDLSVRHSRTTVQRLPILWRKIKKTIRKQIDGWQQELPLF